MFFSADLLNECASLWFQAPMVISSRMQDLAMHGLTGSPGSAVELSRMVSEKMSATAESIMAVNTALAQEGVAVVAAMATGTSTGLAGACDRVAIAALQPYGKRVRANARRLGKQTGTK